MGPRPILAMEFNRACRLRFLATGGCGSGKITAVPSLLCFHPKSWRDAMDTRPIKTLWVRYHNEVSVGHGPC